MKTLLLKTINLCIGLSTCLLISLNGFSQTKEKNKFTKEFVENCLSGVPEVIEASLAKAYCECASEKYYEKAYNPKTKKIDELNESDMMTVIQPCQVIVQDAIYLDAKKTNSSYRKLSLKKCTEGFDSDELDPETVRQYCECSMNKIIDTLSPEELKAFDVASENGEDTPDEILNLIENCFDILR